MPEMHVIRLRGPWEYTPLARTFVSAAGERHENTDDLPLAGRIQLPADWSGSLGPEFRGRVRYVRRFGLPTNLEPHEAVWLVIEGVDYFAAVWLNDQKLGEIVGYGSPHEFDIRRLLADRNGLTLEIDLPAYETAAAAPNRPGRNGLPGGLIGEVRMEIRIAADGRPQGG